MPQTLVAVTRVDTDVRAAVREAMERAGWREAVPKGSRVAVKPNLCWDLPLPGAQTSPWVLDAVIAVLREHTNDIVCVEADQVTVDADVALRRTGLSQVLRDHGVPFINMSRGRFATVALHEPYVLAEIEVPVVLRDRLLVTVPVLKTHGMTLVTGALKNQWGCLKELRHGYHLVVHEAIADLNTVVRPAFAVMDGTIGMEGNGPKTGRPRSVGLVLASADPVALDAVAATVMGFDPTEVPHIGLAAARGVGTSELSEITVLWPEGSPLGLGFRRPRQNLIGRTEFALRRSRLSRVMFDTKVLSALALAAKAWNWLWWVAVGRPAGARVVRGSRYRVQRGGPDVR